MSKKRERLLQNEKAALGLGLAAAVLGGLAYYFYGARHASAHRREAGAWLQDLEREAEKLFEEVRHESFPVAEAALENLVERYASFRGVDLSDLEKSFYDLKNVWKKRLS